MEDSTSSGNLQQQYSQIDDTLQQIWQKAFNSFEDKEYKRVAEYLKTAQVLAIQNNDPITARILTATRQLCLTECDYQAEIELQQKALDKSLRREKNLRQQLLTILELVSGRGMPKTQELSSTPPVTVPRLPESDDPKPMKRSVLWQRIQSLLGRESTPQSPKLETPEISANLQILPATTKLQTLAESPAKEATEQALSLVEKAEVQVAPPARRNKKERPSLFVYCLGEFRVFLNDQSIKDWPSAKGKSVFKYMISHRNRLVPKEILMDIFWPNASPDAARNNLNVAIYGLRQALRNGYHDFSHVLFQDGGYLFNPELQIWVDFEEFLQYFQTARKLEQQGHPAMAIQKYHAAEALYQEEFFVEDRYEEWLMPDRQHLKDTYLTLQDRLSDYYFKREDYAACVTSCCKLLAVEPCRESIHRRLMRCYSRQNQHYLGLRQFHQCVETLNNELDVAPSPQTIHLYEQTRHHNFV